MDNSEVRRITREATDKYKDLFQVQDWFIDVGPDKLDHGSAKVTILPEYRKAYISIDPFEMEDETDVLENLRHEMIHIALSEFKRFSDVASAMVDAEYQEVFDEAYRQSFEILVGQVERMLDCGYRAPLLPDRPEKSRYQQDSE